MNKSNIDSFESIPSKKNAKNKYLKICIILGVIFTFCLIGYKQIIKKISVEGSLSKIYESQQATIYDSKGFEGNTTSEVTITNTKTNETYDNYQYYNDSKTYFAKNGINLN